MLTWVEAAELLAQQAEQHGATPLVQTRQTAKYLMQHTQDINKVVEACAAVSADLG